MKELNQEDMIKIAKDARELGANELHVTGGEPLLRKDIFGILKSCVDLGFNVRLQTNGLLLNKSKINHLKRLGVLDLMVSIDGMENNHDLLRNRKGAFQKTLSNTITAIQNGMSVRINSVVFRENASDMIPLLKKTTAIGADVHSFFYPTLFDNSDSIHNLQAEEWLKFLDDIGTALVQISNKNMKLIIEKAFASELEIGKGDISCKLLEKEHAVVLCDGRVFPCVMFTHSKNELGIVNSSQAFAKIWKNDSLWKSYSNLLKNYRCRKCQLSPKCRGGCIASNLSQEWTMNCGLRQQKENIIAICPTLKLNLSTMKIASSSADAILEDNN